MEVAAIYRASWWKSRQYVHKHHLPELRVTLMKKIGTCFYDNHAKITPTSAGHKNRPEIQEAQVWDGYDINRISHTLRRFSIPATYFPADGFNHSFRRLYNNDLSKSLQADQTYLVRFGGHYCSWRSSYTDSYNAWENITKSVSSLAEPTTTNRHGRSCGISTERTGEIAERIIKIYVVWQIIMGRTEYIETATHPMSTNPQNPGSQYEGYLKRWKT